MLRHSNHAVYRLVELVPRDSSAFSYSACLRRPGRVRPPVRQLLVVPPRERQYAARADRVVSNDAVVVTAVPLRGGQCLLAALRGAFEVLVDRRLVVVLLNQGDRGVTSPLHRLAGEVGIGRGIQEERARVVGTDRRAAVAAEGHVAEVDRRHLAGRGGIAQNAQPGHHRAVVCGPAHLHVRRFQSVGRFTSKLTGGAAGSTLTTFPVARQNCGVPADGDAFSSVADSTTAPSDGKPMSFEGTLEPASAWQDVAAAARTVLLEPTVAALACDGAIFAATETTTTEPITNPRPILPGSASETGRRLPAVVLHPYSFPSRCRWSWASGSPFRSLLRSFLINHSMPDLLSRIQGQIVRGYR